MGKLTDDDTIVILKKLGVFIPSFYILFYIVGIIYIAGFKLPWRHLARIPFFLGNNDDFRPGYRPEGNADRALPLASWLCFVSTYLLAAGLIFGIVKSTRKAWDYAVTISVLHWVVSCLGAPAPPSAALPPRRPPHRRCSSPKRPRVPAEPAAPGPRLLSAPAPPAPRAVMVDFPVNYVWWVTAIVATFVLSTLGETSTYYLQDLKEIAVEH